MSQRNIGLLAIVFAALVVTFYVTVPFSHRPSGPSSVLLFGDVESEGITKIRIQTKDESIDLELSDGRWRLPARALYNADYGKVRAFVVKVMGLSVSQLISAEQESHSVLGVEDEIGDKGKGRVVFLDSEGNEVTGLYVGDVRKGGGPQGSSGQYVRRFGRGEVYLVGEPIALMTTVSHWFDSSLANVLPSKIESIRQLHIDENGQEVEEFKLIRSKGDDGSNGPAFDLKEPISDDFEVSELVVSQARSGLENLRLKDVITVGDDSAKDLVFDNKTVYQLSNALSYKILSSKPEAEEEKYYAKIEVEFNSELAGTLKEAFEQESKKSQESQSEQKEDSEKQQEASSSAEPSKKPAKLVLSSPEQAAKLNSSYEKWVFELPPYLGKKFRQTKAELVEAKKQETSGEISEEK